MTRPVFRRSRILLIAAAILLTGSITRLRDGFQLEASSPLLSLA